jgi:hypothetical protein
MLGYLLLNCLKAVQVAGAAWELGEDGLDPVPGASKLQQLCGQLLELWFVRLARGAPKPGDMGGMKLWEALAEPYFP